MKPNYNLGDPITTSAGQKGVIARQPRAGAANICVRINGHKSAIYFPRESVVPGQAPEAPQASAPAPVPPPPPAQAKTEGQLKAMTLEELAEIRRELHARLDEFDTLFCYLTLEQLVNTKLNAAKLAAVVPSHHLTLDAQKIKDDTARALAAAKRIFR